MKRSAHLIVSVLPSELCLPTELPSDPADHSSRPAAALRRRSRSSCFCIASLTCRRAFSSHSRARRPILLLLLHLSAVRGIRALLVPRLRLPAVLRRAAGPRRTLVDPRARAAHTASRMPSQNCNRYEDWGQASASVSLCFCGCPRSFIVLVWLTLSLATCVQANPVGWSW